MKELDPLRPLTRSEAEVAGHIADGWTYSRIAEWLGITRKTVSVHVANIAEKLDNPDKLKPHELVILWAAHRKWLKKHSNTGENAA